MFGQNLIVIFLFWFEKNLHEHPCQKKVEILIFYLQSGVGKTREQVHDGHWHADVYGP
jgi:hypothetical protein